MPANEQQRLDALYRYELLDTIPEDGFDHIVKLAASVCGTPIALLSFVDEHRQWFKARVGLDVEETSRDVSFCAHAVARGKILVVEDATVDDCFKENVLVVDEPGIRFYAGAPVRADDGQPLGTLCVIDTVPRSLADDKKALLEVLARQVESQLEMRRMSLERNRLMEERSILTNMILHDVRGMIASVEWSVDRLARRYADASGSLASLKDGMGELARACSDISIINQGDSSGLVVSPRPVDIGRWFRSVGIRAKAAAERVGIQLELSSDSSLSVVELDVELLERITRNLYMNAIEACDAGSRIAVTLESGQEEGIRISIEDDGPGVAEEDATRIFKPYFSRKKDGQMSTGLGLAFCRLAAETMGGTVEYEVKRPHGSRFTLCLPAAPMHDHEVSSGAFVSESSRC